MSPGHPADSPADIRATVCFGVRVVVLLTLTIFLLWQSSTKWASLAALVPQGSPKVVTVSAASYAPNAPMAPESIVAGFGVGLATRLEVVTSLPLPTNLAGTT